MTPNGGPAVAQRALGGVTRAIDDLTPGQRWTVSLMIGLAVVVLAFGLPSATRTVLPAAARASINAPNAAAPSAAAPQPSLTDLLVHPSARAIEGSTATTAPAPGVAGSGISIPTLPPELKLVALVDPAFGEGDRTDEAMAKRYLATAGLDAPIVPLGDPAATCKAVGAARANLAIAAGPIPPGVRDCLKDAGVVTLSPDDDAPPAPINSTVVTRRGAARSLLDTAARLRDTLGKRVALVADERLRSVMEPVLSRAKSKGLDITSTVWLPAGQPPAGVAVDLAGANPSAVLFATNTENQATIGSQLRTFAPSARLVVLDAADSVSAAGYPPLFDGALAVTSVQFPWHPGAVAARAACRATWETAQTPPAVLGNDELLRALAWCQHAAMAAAAGTRLASAAGVVSALTAQHVDSPITSGLALLPDGGFGPTQIVVATWSVSCVCWGATAPFTDGPLDG